MPESAAAHANDRLARLGRLTLKELREILRDRRTIVTLVLMPLFLYPLMSIAFQQFFLSHLGRPEYTIGFQNLGEGNFLRYLLVQGGLQVADVDDGPVPHQEPGGPPRVRVGIHPRLEELLQEFKIDVGMRLLVASPDDVHADPGRDLAVEVELIYNANSSAGRDAAAAFVEKYLSVANEKLLAARLQRLGVTQRPVPVHTIRRPVESTESGSTTGNLFITAVIPFILILMTITGAVYPAIDLTAGERERGTLEVLMAAPIPRIGILLAKYVTVLAVALLTAAANLLMMTATIAFSGLGPALFGPSGASSGMFASAFGLLLLFAAFFSAVLLVITSSARSFKEAQAYLIPLMLVSLAPGMLGLMPDVELSGVLLVTPLANIVLLGRDLLAIKATGGATFVVVVSTLLYAAAAIGLAARIFGGRISPASSHSGWSDLVRRPRTPQAAPTITAGFVCLALMFPAYYLFFGLLQRAGDNVATQLGLGMLMTAVVFGGIPLAACHLRRVPIAPAFQLPGSAIPLFIAAAFLGLSLWTVCHELVVLLRWNDAALDPKLIETLMTYAKKLRLLPVPFVLLAIAATPAFFEEAFFRGFLFDAFRSRTTPAVTILATALAFGFFHWVSPSPFAAERFVSSTLVGLVLGWVRWRTGSLLPGILVHVLHNGLLTLLLLYEPDLTAQGIGVAQEEHLPQLWIAVGAGAVCIGVATLFAVTSRGRSKA